MKRYTAFLQVFHDGMAGVQHVEDDAGEWVKLEDCMAEVDTLQEEASKLREQNALISDARDRTYHEMIEARNELSRVLRKADIDSQKYEETKRQLKAENTALIQEIYEDEEDTMRYLKAENLAMANEITRLREFVDVVHSAKLRLHHPAFFRNNKN